MSRSERCFGLLLRAYRRATRNELGGDMAQLFADQLRDARGSLRAFWGLWLRTLVDTVRTAPVDRLAARRRRVAEGPSIEDRRGFRLRDPALASVPSLALLLLWALAPRGFSAPWSPTPPIALQAALAALLAGQWLAALLAVRARSLGLRVFWVLVSTLCVGGIVYGPSLVLMAIKLFQAR